MRKFVTIFLFVFSFQMAISQEFEMVRHQVKMGETVRMLSKKYLVEPAEIYRLNKFAIDGIKEGMVLQILVPKKEELLPVEEAAPESTEEVVVVEDNSSAVPEEVTATPIKKKTPKPTKAPVTEAVVPPADVVPLESTGIQEEVTHTVAKGETLYSLSKKYNVTVDEIKTQNVLVLKKGLQTGQVLLIRANN